MVGLERCQHSMRLRSARRPRAWWAWAAQRRPCSACTTTASTPIGHVPSRRRRPCFHSLRGRRASDMAAAATAALLGGLGAERVAFFELLFVVSIQSHSFIRVSVTLLTGVARVLTADTRLDACWTVGIATAPCPPGASPSAGSNRGYGRADQQQRNFVHNHARGAGDGVAVRASRR